MRTGLVGTTALILLAAGAQAKPAADPEVRMTPPASDYAISMRATGAMLEADYFKAPSKRLTSGNACRMYFDPFERERLAAVCR